MSESSEDKTKRKYVHVLTSNPWPFQCSIFYANPTESTRLLDDMKRFKQRLRRKLPTSPMLIRIKLLHRNKVLQAYVSILTANDHCDVIEGVASRSFAVPVNVRGRRFSAERIARQASAIKSQKPHNLNRLLGDRKINRYSLLNVAYLLTPTLTKAQ